jgi:hypothetical protein
MTEPFHGDFTQKAAKTKRMTALNFPPCELRVRDAGGRRQVWDDLRRMWLPLTPEEWVRRHLLAWLVCELGADSGLIVQEYTFMLGVKLFRADVVCFSAAREPLLLAECKAPEVEMDNSTLAQAVKYNSVIRARHVVLTNGLKHYFLEMTEDGEYRQADTLPRLGI